MLSEDPIYQLLSPINSADENFAMDLEGLLQESDTVEDQDDKNGPNHKKKKLIPRRMIGNSSGAKSGANKQRKRQAPNEISKEKKGKSKKKGRRTFGVGEPSEAFQQPEPKGKEEPVTELLKKKSVAEVLKIMRDRVNRRIKNDQIEDMKSYICLLSFVIEHQVSDLFSPIAQSLNKILSQWPARSDLHDIKKNIKDMEDKERDKAKLPTHDDEMKKAVHWRLEEIEHKIKRSDKERRKDSAKTDELARTFLTKVVSVETLSEEFSTAFPWLFGDEIATKEPAVDQFQGSLQTRKKVIVMEDLEKELFDEGNFKVEISDFPGLQDAINVAEGNIPYYLKSFVQKIEDDRGKSTPPIYQYLLVLVSAAVKEMEDLSVDELDWPILRKWAATLNQTKRMQFEVNFFPKLLKKNIHAYISYSRGSEIRG